MNVQHSPASQDAAGASSSVPRADTSVIETSIPSRLDNLTWSGFHTRVILALGITWILDGLEVTLAGALSSAILLLDPAIAGPDLGWRLAYFTGACLGLIVFVMRMWIPESPRWLMIHGRPEEAHAIVDDIERSSIRHPDHAADEV